MPSRIYGRWSEPLQVESDMPYSLQSWGENVRGMDGKPRHGSSAFCRLADGAAACQGSDGPAHVPPNPREAQGGLPGASPPPQAVIKLASGPLARGLARLTVTHKSSGRFNADPVNISVDDVELGLIDLGQTRSIDVTPGNRTIQISERIPLRPVSTHPTETEAGVEYMFDMQRGEISPVAVVFFGSLAIFGNFTITPTGTRRHDAVPVPGSVVPVPATPRATPIQPVAADDDREVRCRIGALGPLRMTAARCRGHGGAILP